MDHKRILFLVDFKYRDLPGLVLVKTLLEAKGPYEVILVPHVPTIGERIYLRKFRPHMVVFPYYINPVHVSRACRLKENGIGVAVMPTEGTAIVDEARLQLAGKFVDLNPVDIFFVWNQTIADLIRVHQTTSPDRCVVAGVPRFDFYHPRFRTLMLSKQSFCAQYGLNLHWPIVTWTTNFGLVWFAGKPEETANLIKRQKEEGLGGSAICGNIPDLIERELESRQALTEGVLRIAKLFPKTNVVIKVHPAEEAEWYREQIARVGLGNVSIIAQEYIWNVLNSTDILLHRSCTTAIESWLLDKPTIDLQFGPREWYFAKEFAGGGDVAFSLDDFLSRVRYYLPGGAIPTEQWEARPRIIEWFCGRVDGQSARHHVEAIHNWLQSSDREPRAPSWSKDDLQFAITAQIKSVLGLQPYHSLHRWLMGETQDGRGKYFTTGDVEAWTSGIKQILNGTGGTL